MSKRPDPTPALIACLLLLSLPSCGESPGIAGAAAGELAVRVQALTLEDVTGACYTVAVFNTDVGPYDASTTVWTRSFCSDEYGTSDGAVSYVGPCDASGPGGTRANTVALVLDEVQTSGGALVDGDDYQNPCRAIGDCTRIVTCRANADASVVFDLTIARSAEQGFFDIAVEFDDIFCSAKADCARDLLFNGDVRDDTLVLALACSAGPNADTTLYRSDVYLVCDGIAVATFDPASGVGNRPLPPGAPNGVFGWAVYRGFEQLPDVRKAYWNVAVGIAPTFFEEHTGCSILAWGTARPDELPAPFSIGRDGVYPYVLFDVPLDPLGEERLSCGAQPLDGAPDVDLGGVATAYAGRPGEPTVCFQNELNIDWDEATERALHVPANCALVPPTTLACGDCNPGGCDLVNVARTDTGATATATGEHQSGDYPPGRALDGDLTTPWVGPYCFGCTTHTMTVELAGVRRLTGFALYGEIGDDDPTTSAVLEYDQDGSWQALAWTPTIVESTGRFAGVFAAGIVTSRVRVTVSTPNVSSPVQTVLYEFELYGAPTTCAPSCQLGLCDGATGTCGLPAPDGTSCADADVCNGTETCEGGACTPGEPDPDLCAPVCRATCGDGTCESSESCLDCPADCACEPAGCGDGLVSGGEACEDGNLSTNDLCVDCQLAFPAASTIAGGPRTYRSGVTIVGGDTLLATWSDGGHVRFRRFDLRGVPLDPTELDVGATAAGRALRPIDFGDGTFGIFWEVGTRVSGVRYTNTCPPEQIGADDLFAAESFDLVEGAQVAGLDGGVVVAWAGSSDGSGSGIFARRFDADGTPLGLRIAVNVRTDGEQAAPDVAALDGGGFVVVWDSVGGDADGRAARARLFQSDGDADSGEIPLNVRETGLQQGAVVGAVPGGGFIAAWNDRTAASPGQNEVAFARFGAGGVRLDAVDRSANEQTAGYQGPSAIVVNATGGVLIGWSDGGGGCEGGCPAEDSEARLFKVDGTPLSDDLVMSGTSSGFSSWPAAVARPDGDFVVLDTVGGDSANTAAVLGLVPAPTTGCGIETCDGLDSDCDLAVDELLSGVNDDIVLAPDGDTTALGAEQFVIASVYQRGGSLVAQGGHLWFTEGTTSCGGWNVRNTRLTPTGAGDVGGTHLTACAGVPGAAVESDIAVSGNTKLLCYGTHSADNHNYCGTIGDTPGAWTQLVDYGRRFGHTHSGDPLGFAVMMYNIETQAKTLYLYTPNVTLTDTIALPASVSNLAVPRFVGGEVWLWSQDANPKIVRVDPVASAVVGQIDTPGLAGAVPPVITPVGVPGAMFFVATRGAAARFGRADARQFASRVFHNGSVTSLSTRLLQHPSGWIVLLDQYQGTNTSFTTYYRLDCTGRILEGPTTVAANHTGMRGATLDEAGTHVWITFGRSTGGDNSTTHLVRLTPPQ